MITPLTTREPLPQLDDAAEESVTSELSERMFISAGAAIGMISVLHQSGGFTLVLSVNAVIALLLFVTTVALVALIVNVEGKHAAAQPAE